MRISIQACIEGEGAQPSKVITVGVIEREDSFAPASGLGLFMRETHALLKQLQTVIRTNRSINLLSNLRAVSPAVRGSESKTQSAWSIARHSARRACAVRGSTRIAVRVASAQVTKQRSRRSRRRCRSACIPSGAGSSVDTPASCRTASRKSFCEMRFRAEVSFPVRASKSMCGRSEIVSSRKRAGRRWSPRPLLSQLGDRR